MDDIIACYVIYSRSDPFSLPCAVFESKADCARWLGVSVSHLCLNMFRGYATNGYMVDEVFVDDYFYEL